VFSACIARKYSITGEEIYWHGGISLKKLNISIT
jgi:hypothetical protein